MRCLLVLFFVACCILSVSGSYPLTYNPPRSCTGSARSGLIALRNVVMRHHSFFRDSGIYNCRNARGGGSLSEHAEGRAWDAGIRVGDSRAQAVAEWMVANAEELGLQSVIFNRRVWGYGRWSWRSYSGVNPHTDHIHVAMNLQAAPRVTEADVERAFGGGGGARPPPPPPNNPPPPPPPNNPPPDGPAPESCVRATSAVNVRSQPSTGSNVMLVAFAGEQFTKVSTSGSWLKVSNPRGSGYSFGQFWSNCGNRAAGAGVVDETDGAGAPLLRVADGPSSGMPDWAWGVIGGVVGTIVVAGIVIVVVVLVRRRNALRAAEVPLMENKVGPGGGSSNVVPQLRRRNSFTKV